MPEDENPRRGARRGDLMLLGRTNAGIALLGHSGMTRFELAYEENPIQWWAEGNWNGTRVFSQKFPYPAMAVEDLLARVLNGGQCGRCHRTTVVGIIVDGDYCCFTLVAEDLDDDGKYRYIRTCEVEGDEV